MKFKMPTASRKRLEDLLEYLGNTGNYSEYYKGNRVEDFKKCFDIESEWCWKYADLVLRGMKKRNMEYGEVHHVVPATFYGTRKYSVIEHNNITVLTFMEHLYAHYCMAKCGVGIISGKMAHAFCMMLGRGRKTNQLPEPDELVKIISEAEIIRLRLNIPGVQNVTKSGRSHRWEVTSAEYKHEYYEATKEKSLQRSREWYQANKEHANKRSKEYNRTHSKQLKKARRTYRIANHDKITEKERQYHADHREEKNKYSAEWRKAHPEYTKEYYHEYYLKNREKKLAQVKSYKEKNPDKIKKRKHEHYLKNIDKIKDAHRKYAETHKEQRSARDRKYRETHRKEHNEKNRKYRERKKESGYRRIKIDGHEKWVFVDLPATPETPKSSTTAA